MKRLQLIYFTGLILKKCFIVTVVFTPFLVLHPGEEPAPALAL